MLATQKEPLTRESLRQYFFNGCKASNDLKIGVEWEKIGVAKDSGKAIRYSGPQGVAAIFVCGAALCVEYPFVRGAFWRVFQIRTPFFTLRYYGNCHGELVFDRACVLEVFVSRPALVFEFC